MPLPLWPVTVATAKLLEKLSKIKKPSPQEIKNQRAKTDEAIKNCSIQKCPEGRGGTKNNKKDTGGNNQSSGKVKANKIPATTSESVNEKLQKYLLDINHPVGGSKAKWFKKSLGFTQDNFNDLAKQIRFDPSKAIQTGATQYGTKFNQIIKITGANGKEIDVTFGWIRNRDGIVRLVTGIPTKK
jgi:hypothetical protein